MLRKTLLITALIAAGLAGCAQMPDAQKPQPVAKPVPTQTARPQPDTGAPGNSVEPADSGLCSALAGQSQAYLKNMLTANRSLASQCASDGRHGQCWNKLAEQMDSQQTGVNRLLNLAQAHACTEAVTLLGVAQPYLQSSASVARNCAIGGLPKCLAGQQAEVTKQQREALTVLLGSDH